MLVTYIEAVPTATSTSFVATRSVFQIIWGCWATIFICTWTSVHPNIPPPGQGPLSALWRRLTLIFWALIVPELILTWAVKQWLAAREIENTFKKDHRWTKTHAHFLGMGGFTLANFVIGDRPSDQVPQIPDLTVPVQPEMPELRTGGDRERFWREMREYWEDSRRYQESRRQFWTKWECFQKNCSDYTYYYTSLQTRFPLIDLDLEDYQRYETYGFPLPDPFSYLSESPGTLTFYRFRELVDKSLIAFPTITADEIKDRSKGDFISKAIAICQTTWFITQFVARGIQGLAITELELVTLALAALNGITYFFWWDKPLNVQQPVVVYPRGVFPVERNDSEDEKIQSFFEKIFQNFRTAPQGLLSTFDALRNPTSTSAFLNYQTEETLKYRHIPIIVLRWLFYLPIAFIVKSLYSIIDTDSIFPGATHVPIFYATNVGSSNSDKHFIYFALPFISILFGGLHCVGWNFSFPTTIEQMMWRVSSLCITAIPLVVGLVWFLIREKYLSSEGEAAFLLYPALSLLVVYVLARFLLLAQAMALLGREPLSAYQRVDWSKYFLHMSLTD